MTKTQRNKYMRDRYAARPDVREYQIAQTLARYHAGHWVEVQSSNLNLKEEVLTHYGHGGKLQCCWPGCEVTDLDMLSLDHIHDDGAAHRKALGLGTRMYQWAKSHDFPKDVLQTMCCNHQMKKEVMRRHRLHQLQQPLQ